MPISEILSTQMDVDAFRPEHLPNVAKLASYARPEAKKSLFQLFNTIVPFAAIWFILYKSLSFPYWVTLLLAIPAAGLEVRLFIMQHDAGHGSFFKSKKANDFLGFWIGVLTLTPYEYWQKTHAIHHATSGNLDERGFGDIDTMTVREYMALSPARKLQYRAYRHPLTMFFLGPFFQFVIRHRYPYNIPRAWKREWRSVYLTNLALAGVLFVAWKTVGIKTFLLIQAPVTLMCCAIGSWLFYIQHQYEDTYWERDENWDYFDASMKGSSMYVLPKVLQWFTGNIGIHHVHHYNSRIPNYKLQACFDENPELQNVTRLTLWSSLKCTRLALWDEDRKKLIGFRDLNQEPQRMAA
jgi:acyl-lipid omega-6 desaturase (Delta-12 desaturase)